MAVFPRSGAVLLDRLFLEIHSASALTEVLFHRRRLLRHQLGQPDLPRLTFVIQKRSLAPYAQWDSQRIQAVLVGRWHGNGV